MRALAREAPDLRCELIEAEPEQSLPALALGDVDLVLADEWQHQPLARPAGIDREDLHRDPVHLVLPEDHPAARRHRRRRAAGRARRRGLDHRPPGHRRGRRSSSAPAASSAPSTPTSATAPTTASLSLALVADGQAVTLLPELVWPELHPGVAVRAIAEGSVHRTIFAATRAADAERPSVQALLAAVRAAAADLGWA